MRQCNRRHWKLRVRTSLLRGVLIKKRSWFICQREEGNPNDMYTVAVKTDRMKTIQIKRNNDFLSFRLHFIINFVPTERKLAHSLVEFPARLISHFSMNILMAKTGCQSNSTKWPFSPIRQKIFLPKFPAIYHFTFLYTDSLSASTAHAYVGWSVSQKIYITRTNGSGVSSF